MLDQQRKYTKPGLEQTESGHNSVIHLVQKESKVAW